MLRKATNRITRSPITRTQWEKETGRPKNTRRRELGTSLNDMGKTWNELQEVADDRRAWCGLIAGIS